MDINDIICEAITIYLYQGKRACKKFIKKYRIGLDIIIKEIYS